jgi:hypothetical protein
MGVTIGEIVAEAILSLPLFIYDFQALIGAIIALGAAGWTVRTMRDQTRVVDEHERVRRSGRRLAARALLPSLLDRVSAHANAHGGCFRAIYVEFVSTGRPSVSPVQIPALDPAIRGELATLLEIESVPAIQTAIGEMLRFIQLMDARGSRRISPRSDDFITQEHIGDQLAMAVFLFALTSSLFQYARMETEEYSRSEISGHIYNALVELDIMDAEFHPVRLMVQNLVDGRDTFWRPAFV